MVYLTCQYERYYSVCFTDRGYLRDDDRERYHAEDTGTCHVAEKEKCHAEDMGMYHAEGKGMCRAEDKEWYLPEDYPLVMNH